METAELPSAQLLQQAGVSTFALANAAPQQSGKDVPAGSAIQEVSRRDIAA